MRNGIFTKMVAAAVLAATALLGGCATTAAPTASAMRDGGLAMPPAGWMDFCRRNSGDPSCQAVQLDTRRWRELQAVQASLRSVRRDSDERAYGKAEYWTVATAAVGDCEDIALAARAQLMQAGWPVSALRLATAWTERKEYHVVLTVDVARNGTPETLVLDSRFAVVLSWDKLKQMGYRFTTRQAARGPQWVLVNS